MPLRNILFLLTLTSCSLFFGGNDQPKSAKNSEYTIKFSAPEWIQKDDKRSDFVFENTRDGRILLSNSFCEEFQDQPLEHLATKTFQTMSNFKKTTAEYMTFQNREAHRLEGTGEVDGVKVNLKILNTRRNNCYFDFLSIVPAKTALPGDSSFDDFLKSVEFK